MYNAPYINSRSSSRAGGAQSGMSMYASSIISDRVGSGIMTPPGGFNNQHYPMKRGPGPPGPGPYGPGPGGPGHGPYGHMNGGTNTPPYSQQHGGHYGGGPMRPAPPLSPSAPSAVSGMTRGNLKKFYKAFQQYTETSGVASPRATPNAPGVKARPKLQKLTDIHFTELATDVYDELMRRINPAPNEMQHLAPRTNIHPKRNEAREKLSLLSPSRFSDLVSDLQYEARRRDPSVDDSYVPPPQNNTNLAPATAALEERSLSPLSDGPFTGENETKVHIPIRDSSKSTASTNNLNSGRNSTVSVATSRYSDVSLHRASEGLNIASVKPTLLTPEKSTLVEEDDDDDDDNISDNGNTAHSRSTSAGSVDKMKEKDEHIEMLVNEGSRMDKMINELEQQLQESESLKSTLVEENGRLHDMVNDLEDEKIKFNSEKDSLRAQIDELQKEKGNLELQAEKYNLINEEVTELKAKYESAKNLADKHKADLDSTREQLEHAQKELEEAKAAAVVAAASSAVVVKSDPDELEALQQQHAQTLEELAQQRQVTEQVRMEASAFLEEMRALTAQNATAHHMGDQIQTLKMEIQEWKSRYTRAKSQLRNMKAASVVLSGGNNMSDLSPAYLRADGAITYAHISKFQMCMDEFIYKARSNTGDILEFLHAVVVATREITQEVGSADPQVKSEELEADMAQWTSIVSKTANQLIATTRNHRLAGGLAPFAVLDAAASDLSYAVIELVKLAGIQKDSVGNGVRDEIFDDDENKENDISTPAHISSVKRESYGASAAPTSPTTSFKQQHNRAGSQAVSSHSRHSVASAQFDKDDPDNTVSELQAFLEERTGEAIENVQELLAGIKQSQPSEKLVPVMYRIVELLDEIIEASRKSMQHTRNKLLRDRGSYIVQSLADCVERVRALHDQVLEEPPEEELERQISQRVAGVSFDIARCTQELVKTVEEVSLML